MDDRAEAPPAPEPGLRDQVIGLAGLFQALRLVQTLAHRGSADEDAERACVDSLFAVDAPSAGAVWGGLARLRLGLETLIAQLSGQGRDAELTRYAVAVLVVERRLAARPDLLDRVRQGIEEAGRRAAETGDRLHPAVMAVFASTYRETAGQVATPVMVRGAREHLESEAVAARIRTLLLAAIRAAVLWRQKGGTRWGLLWRRRRYVAAARALLARTAVPA